MSYLNSLVSLRSGGLIDFARSADVIEYAFSLEG